MKLFTVGPVEMYPETLQVSGTQRHTFAMMNSHPS